MKPLRPYSITFSVLLVLGMLTLWASASIGVRTATPVSFSCEELEECLEEELQEGLRKGFSMGLPDDVSIVETEVMRFVLLPCAIESPSSDCPSGWIMPLRI